MNKKTEQSSSHVAGIGLGIAALAATVAGAYYLYGSDKAAQNRKHMKSWMLKMKADVMDEMETAKEFTQDTYEKVIDKVSKKYSAVKSVDTTELADLVKRMKDHWKEISEDVTKTIGHEVKKVTK